MVSRITLVEAYERGSPHNWNPMALQHWLGWFAMPSSQLVQAINKLLGWLVEDGPVSEEPVGWTFHIISLVLFSVSIASFLIQNDRYMHMAAHQRPHFFRAEAAAGTQKIRWVLVRFLGLWQLWPFLWIPPIFEGVQKWIAEWQVC